MFIRICFLFVAFMLQAGSQVYAADMDARFAIHVEQDQANDTPLDIQSAMLLALPTLWQRVVPTADLERAMKLKGRTSLVLQFKRVNRGIDLVFNPIQVQSYLRGYGITMIPERPHWHLSIAVVGFSDNDAAIAHDLMNYSYGMTDTLGFTLSPHGKRLQLTFAPMTDAYAQAWVHVDVQGAFSSDILSQTEQVAQGFISYQLQDWVAQILREIRDAYSLGTLNFKETSSQTLLTIEAEFSLATQVMLEQALATQPQVMDVVPTLLQKARRQYRLLLRDDDDSWIASWFAGYGLTATKQPEGSESHWLVQ